jgi:hypothetical protein
MANLPDDGISMLLTAYRMEKARDPKPFGFVRM